MRGRHGQTPCGTRAMRGGGSAEVVLGNAARGVRYDAFWSPLFEVTVSPATAPVRPLRPSNRQKLPPSALPTASNGVRNRLSKPPSSPTVQHSTQSLTYGICVFWSAANWLMATYCPSPWTPSLRRRWCPSASHRPVSFLSLLGLSFPLYFPFLSLGRLCHPGGEGAQ